MQTITIAQKNITEAGFEATLTIEGSTFAIKVRDPFGLDGREKALEWYFEEWIRVPLMDTTIAARAARSVKEYGIELFDQVFENKRAFATFERLAGSLGDVEILIEGDPGFQALHWEAMWDRDRVNPLAMDAVMVRQRQVEGGVPPVDRKESTVLNLLVVTARPDEDKDVGYRTISRPLVEAIEAGKLPVNVEFVRPGTYEAFVRQLDKRGAGYYHMVHFDMHGGLLTFEQLGLPREAQRLTLERGYGLSTLAEYEGVQAVLSFEGDEMGQAVLVTAKDLSDRLKKYGISACVLNACQSGKQTGDVGETSLGAQLMDAGLQMVVAMAYSVTVDAAKILVAQLYGRLCGGEGIEQALLGARKELYEDKVRSAYWLQKVDLEDWLLPVVYRNQAVDLKLRRMDLEEKRAFRSQQSKRFQFLRHFPTTYGFVGRDLEILKIEKGLIRDGNILMLYGMGGTGKTTLVRYLQDWWVQTGFVEGVSYFGYDEKAWNLQQILFNIAKDLLSDDDLREFQSMSIEEQAEELSHGLRTRRWLVVLDNLESVTGQALAIQNTLNASEQAAIRGFLMQIKRGQTRVVLGSRRREDWLSAVYGGNEYELRGLDGLARTELAEKVLERHVKEGGKRRSILADKEFARLMKLLAGYPLAIEVVLSNLGRQSVGEVLAGLDGADVSLDRSGSKTESILQCVEYSHGNLSVAAQRSLLCLALFSGFIDRNDLGNYVKKLQAAGDAFGDLTLEALDGAVGEAIAWGLLTPMDVDNPNLLTIQPVFPYFLKTKLVQEDGAFCEALRLGFKNHYEGLAGDYKNLMNSRIPQQQQHGKLFCELEYENLYKALQISLDRQDSIQIYFSLFYIFKLNSNLVEMLNLSMLVHESLNRYSVPNKQKIKLETVLFLEGLAYCHDKMQNQRKARKIYGDILLLYEEIPMEDRRKSLWRSNIYNQLGAVSLDLREYEEAYKNYKISFRIKTEINDRYGLATVYHQLGLIDQSLRKFEDARCNYQQALEIKTEFNDRQAQSSTYHQLGSVARELREFEEARWNYNQSLQIRIEFNERHNQAGTYQQLGMVAQALQEYSEAQFNYRKALELLIEFKDSFNQANTYNQLGSLAVVCRELEEARNNYRLGLNIFIDYNDRHSQALSYHNLGVVAQELKEFEEARRNYQLALQMKIEYGDRYSQANTYGQLGLLAEEEEQLEEAIQKLLTALEVFGEFQDNHSAAMTFRDISRIYKSHPSPQFLSQITQALGSSETEVLQLFGAMG
jgi:tetratricopeptide (TPR) repeat protein/type II secretory pathway predicted ATPase ExeA